MGFYLEKYISMLDEKVREGIDKLETTSICSEEFRTLVVNINNAYMTAREYENVIYNMENNTENVTLDKESND